MIKKLTAALLATLFLTSVFGSLAGCNTMEGAGKDIERGLRAQGRQPRGARAPAVAHAQPVELTVEIRGRNVAGGQPQRA